MTQHDLPGASAQQDLVNLILVEDDDADAMAIDRAISKAGVNSRISRAVDGLDALDILRGTPEDRPSRFVMLVDLNLPRMNGIELLSEMRKDPQLQPIVAFVLTTSRDPRDIAAAYSENAAGYFVKGGFEGAYNELVTMLNSYFQVVEFPALDRYRHDG